MNYRVIGEYGVMSDMCIKLVLKADSAEEAVAKFCETVKKKYPEEWETMGKHNVYADLV